MKLKHSILLVLPLATSASCTVDTTPFPINPEDVVSDTRHNDTTISEGSGITLELESTEFEEDIEEVNLH